MNRRGVSWIALGALATGLGWLPQAAMSATTKAEQSQTAARMVEEALRNEVTGSDADRNKVLHGVLEQSPGYAPALWHSGYVHERNKWVKFDEASKLSADDERLTAYRRVRQQYSDSAEGHLELAEWCAKKKLVDQQRAHLTSKG